MSTFDEVIPEDIRLIMETSRLNKNVMQKILEQQFNHNDYSSIMDGVIDPGEKANRQCDSMIETINFYNDLGMMDFMATQPLQGSVGIAQLLMFKPRFDDSNHPSNLWEYDDLTEHYVPTTTYNDKFLEPITKDEYEEACSQWDEGSSQMMLTLESITVESKSYTFNSSDRVLEANCLLLDYIRNAAIMNEADIPESPHHLVIAIMKEQIEIARASRRGGGNKVLLTKNLYNLIKESNQFVELPDFEHKNFQKAGMLNNGLIEVYYTNHTEDDFMLVGYKGPTSSDFGEADGAIAFMPNITKIEKTTTGIGNSEIYRFENSNTKITTSMSFGIEVTPHASDYYRCVMFK